MSTYSPILRTELIGDGQQPGAWGATTNSNFQYIFEAAIAGYVAVTVSPTSNNQVLTYTNGPSATASLDQTVYGILKLVPGTLGANFNIYAPPVSKTYIVWNSTSYTATFYNSTIIGNTTAAGSGITIPAGAKVWIWSDGASFYGNDTVAGNLKISGTLNVTGLSTLSGGVSSTTGAFSGAVSATNYTGPGTGLTGTAASLNIGGNAATATNPQSGGSFITSSNIGSQSVSYATNAGNASTVTNGVYNDGGLYNINVTGSASVATNANYAGYAGSANALNSGNYYNVAGLTVTNSISCRPYQGPDYSQGHALVNTDDRIGGWSVGSSYLQVYVDGSAYGISIFPSDESIKKNIVSSTYDALDTVNKIEFKEFDYNEEKTFAKGHVDCGLTSQQLEQVDSSLVFQVNDLKQPNESKLLYIALKAIQELETKVAALEAKLAK